MFISMYNFKNCTCGLLANVENNVKNKLFKIFDFLTIQIKISLMLYFKKKNLEVSIIC